MPQTVFAVFPLLGRALPEAFQVDVEPEWPSFVGAAPAAAMPPPVLAPGVQVPTAPLASTGHHAPFTFPTWLDPAPAAAAVQPVARAPGPAPAALPPAHGGLFAPIPPVGPAARPPEPPGAPLPADPPGGAFTLPPWLEPLPQTGRHDGGRLPAAEPAASFSPFGDADGTIRRTPVSAPGTFPAWLEPLPPAAPGLAPVESDKLSFPSPVAAAPPPATPAMPEPASVHPPVADEPGFQEPGFQEPVFQEPVFQEKPRDRPLAAEPPMFREPPMFQTSEFPTVMPVASPQQSPAYVQHPAAPFGPATPLPPAEAESPAIVGRKPLSDLFRALGARPARPPGAPHTGGGNAEDRTTSF